MRTPLIICLIAILAKGTLYANCDDLDHETNINRGNIFEIHDLLKELGVRTILNGDVATFVEVLDFSLAVNFTPFRQDFMALVP